MTWVSVLDNSSCPDICFVSIINRNVQDTAPTIQLSNAMASESSDSPVDVTWWTLVQIRQTKTSQFFPFYSTLYWLIVNYGSVAYSLLVPSSPSDSSLHPSHLCIMV